MAKLVTTDRGVGRMDGSVVSILQVEAPDLGAVLADGVELGTLAGAPVREEVDLGAVRLAAPIPRPSKIWGVGYAYRSHRKEVGFENDASDPVVFFKAPSSVIGTGEPIVLPPVAPDHVDYEGELGVVIGRRATAIDARDAYAYVAGFTIVNDVSARDVQKGWIDGRLPDTATAKSFDTFAPMGPCIATLDELADPDDLQLRTLVNDELRQDARTADLVFPVPALVAYLSRQTTLEPGDVISTGTPEGVGHPQGLFLRDGDTVRIEIEGIGALENPVRHA